MMLRQVTGGKKKQTPNKQGTFQPLQTKKKNSGLIFMKGWGNPTKPYAIGLMTSAARTAGDEGKTKSRLT